MVTLFLQKIIIPDEALLKGFPEERKSRILQCKNEQERARSFTGNLLLWRAFQESQGREVTFPKLSYGKAGKPYLEEYEDFYFSISHSGHYAACAVSDEAVGMDLQKSVPYQEKLAQRFFTPAENRLLEQAEEGAKKQLFFRLWSAKEACVKYTGEGLSGGLDSFTIELEQGIARKEKEIFFLNEHIFIEDKEWYYISVCTKKKEEICLRQYIKK